MISAGKNEFAIGKAVSVILCLFLAYVSIPTYAVAAVDPEGSEGEVVHTETSPSGVEVDVVVPRKVTKSGAADGVAQSDFKAGMGRLESGDYDGAIELLQAALTAAPQRIDIRLALGQAYEAAGRLDDAIETYGEARRRAPPGSDEVRLASMKEQYAIATRYAKSGEVNKALPIFRSLVAESPENTLFIYSVGVAYMVSGRLIDAERAFRKVLTLDQGYIRAYLNLAEIYKAKGDFRAAIEELREVVSRDPQGPVGRKASVDLRIIEGRLLSQQGNLTDALNVYREGLALEPENPELLFLAADLYRRLDRPAEEEQAYATLIKVTPDNLQARLRLAEIYLGSNRIRAGYEQIRTILAAAPDTPIGMQASAMLDHLRSTKEGQLIEAQRLVDKINEYRARLAAAPDDIATRTRLALLYLQQQMYADARREFEQVLVSDPRNKVALVSLGSVYDKLGLFGEAVDAYSRYVSLEKNEENVKQVLPLLKLVNAKRLYVEGRSTAAMKEFEAILDVEPNNPVAHFYLGLIYAKLDNVMQAVDAYQEVIKLVPTHVGARLNLALSYERLNREEDAINEYRKILQAHPPKEIEEAVRTRLAAAEKRIGGFFAGANYVLISDNNANLSDQFPAHDIRSELALNLAYQHKMHNGVRLRFTAAPQYVTYHIGQFDFLNTNTTISATTLKRNATVVGGYTHRTSRSLLTSRRYSVTDTLFGEVLRRIRLPRVIGGAEGEVVSTSLVLDASYTDFDSDASPFFSSSTTALGASLSQPVSSNATMKVGYNFVDNQNKELVGSDYAYYSHGFSLSLERAMSPRIVANLNYGFTLFNFLHPDSVSSFTETRRNTLHSLALGASYRFNQTVSFFSTLSAFSNHSNLPVGVVLNAQDIVDGQQSSSLGNYQRLMISAGVNVNF